MIAFPKLEWCLGNGKQERLIRSNFIVKFSVSLNRSHKVSPIITSELNAKCSLSSIQADG